MGIQTSLKLEILKIVNKQSYPLHWRVPLSMGEQLVFKCYLTNSTLIHVLMVN